MRKLRIKFLSDGKEEVRTAVLTDNFSHPIPHEDNQADGVVDGVADELGIWSIYFDQNQTEADFVCEVVGDSEIKTLTPVEIWLWNKKQTKTIPFTVEEI